MLKQCLNNIDFSRLHAKQQLRPKCGEIFYESDNECASFQLVCCLCEMKHFAFEDFSMHIRNVHVDKHGKPRTQPQTRVQAHAQPRNQAHISPDGQLPPSNELLSADSDEDDEVDLADAANYDQLRVRLFNAVKVESTLNETNKTEKEQPNDSFHGHEDLDMGTAAGQEHSDADATDGDDNAYATDGDATEANSDEDSLMEMPSIFKKRQAKEYKCKYCTGKYTTLKYLNMHLKMRHPYPKGFKCNDCDATFDVNRALETHRRKLHTKLTCNLCKKVYKSSRTLLRHIQGHSGLRQYKCEHENCGKTFVSQHNLTSHRRIHTTDRNYICELCGYRSRYRDALVVHRRTHTGEKPFKCQTCERCFASKSLLNEHQAMHSTERPYKCDKCEATFSRPKALYHHKHLHLGIKKFKCRICGNAYAQAAGLSAHMRGHKAQAVNGIDDCGSTPACPLF